MNERVAKYLCYFGVNDVQFSIEGINMHKKIKSSSTFNQVVSGIKALSLAKQVLGVKLPHIDVNFVRVNNNLEELPDLVRTLSKLGWNCLILNLNSIAITDSQIDIILADKLNNLSYHGGGNQH